MASTTASVSCRICCRFSLNKHSISLFPRVHNSSDVANRISRVINCPVAADDGMSHYICRPCNRKFLAAETFIMLAKASYAKSITLAPTSELRLTPVNTPVKRSKDTSGLGVSPHTEVSRPAAKRQTVAGPGRRLNFSVENEVQGQLPLREITNDTQAPTAVQHPTTAHQQGRLPLREISNDTAPTAVQHPTTARQQGQQLLPLREISNDTRAPTAVHPTTAQQPNAHTTGNITGGHSVTISVYSPSKQAVVTVPMSSNFEKLGRALAGGNIHTICRAIFSHPSLREEVTTRVSRIVDSECASLCSRSVKPVSLFRSMTLDEAEMFSWSQAIDELEAKAPTLFSILKTAVVHSSRRNKHKTGDMHFPGLCTSVAILMKERNREMCGIQSYVSTALFSSHIQKKAWTRLNHINVTLSYNGILKRVKQISKRHTRLLDKWLSDGAFVKFIGDNVDKQINVRDIRSDHQGKLVHMFSLMAVKDRVPPPDPLTAFVTPTVCTNTVDRYLPTKEEITIVQDDLEVLISRILCKYITGFHKLKQFVSDHIPHTYSSQMATKSEIAVLDVLHNNEIEDKEMIEIMRVMVSYLRTVYKHRALSGGDHVTCEREQGAKRHVQCSNSSTGRLDQLEPVVEDWHCVMNFMILIWQKLYKSSQEDYGTLHQLLARIGRSKAKKPKEDMHSCQDALMAVFMGHMVAAACKELDITEPDEEIKRVVNRTLLKDVTRKVVRKFTVITETLLGKEVVDNGDRVHGYARVLCHFASLVLLFIDAWKEGDGERVLRYWKIFMLHFRAENKTKYALEALRLQFQLVTLPPYLSHQIIWGRFINTQGGKGRNLPCDLHNEHVNKVFKDIIQNMGPNFTKEACTWAARSVSSLQRVSKVFDKQTFIHSETVAHSKRSDDKDVKMVAQVLLKSRVVEVVENRAHRMFPTFSPDPLHKLDRDKMKKWIKRKAKEYMKSDTATVTDSDTEDNGQIMQLQPSAIEVDDECVDIEDYNCFSDD